MTHSVVVVLVDSERAKQTFPYILIRLEVEYRILSFDF